MEVLTRHGGLNSEVCDHHPEIIEEAGRLGWELIGHNRTNALRLTEMDASQEREAGDDRPSARSAGSAPAWPRPGTRSITSRKRGIRYVCDWVNDDQPYLFEIGSPPLVSL